MSVTHGGIAQLGERLNGIQEVSGSIPLISTKSKIRKLRFTDFLLKYTAVSRGKRGAIKKESSDSFLFFFLIHSDDRGRRYKSHARIAFGEPIRLPFIGEQNDRTLLVVVDNHRRAEPGKIFRRGV